MISPCLVAVFALAVSDFARVESYGQKRDRHPNQNSNYSGDTISANDQKHSDEQTKKEVSKNNCFEWFFNLAERYNGTILAFLTAILAFATARLWVATRDLVNDGKKHSERELRAYMCADAAAIWKFGIKDTLLTVAINMVNAGQTPALEFAYGIEISVEKEPEKPFPNVTFVPEDIFVGPKVEHNCIRQAWSLTPEQEKNIEKGDCVLWVYAKFRYLDIFDTWHRFNFMARTVSQGGKLLHRDEACVQLSVCSYDPA